MGGGVSFWQLAGLIAGLVIGVASLWARLTSKPRPRLALLCAVVFYLGLTALAVLFVNEYAREWLSAAAKSLAVVWIGVLALLLYRALRRRVRGRHGQRLPRSSPELPARIPPPRADGRPPFADDPRQLLDYLDSLPLLQQDDARRGYRGVEVVWQGELQSLSRDETREDHVLLQAWFDRGKRRYFLASVPRAPGLESLDQGNRVKVTGTIDSLLPPPHIRLSAARVIL